jgi:hypothetical protein
MVKQHRRGETMANRNKGILYIGKELCGMRKHRQGKTNDQEFTDALIDDDILHIPQFHNHYLHAIAF